jgi:hypothetical protein
MAREMADVCAGTVDSMGHRRVLWSFRPLAVLPTNTVYALRVTPLPQL